MDAEYINPFLLAAKNVLETMAQTKVRPMKPKLKQEKTTYGEVTGIIGMVSNELQGSMVISFSKVCILKVVANMLMEPVKPDIDGDIVDAVGEITNMICGGAKAELGKKGIKFDLATPTMVVGKDIEIKSYTDSPIIVIPFETDAGDFVIEANLSKRKKHGP